MNIQSRVICAELIAHKPDGFPYISYTLQDASGEELTVLVSREDFIGYPHPEAAPYNLEFKGVGLCEVCEGPQAHYFADLAQLCGIL